MKKNIILILTLGLLVYSCNKNEKADILVTETTQENNDVSEIVTDSSSAISSQNTSVTNVATPQIVSSAITTAPGMNPPHGEPGHRCDIPVGEPLNSAPQNAIAPVQTAIPTPAQVVAPALSATAPGTNPPHGEPGHRCDIPVGDPLPAN